MSVCVCADVKYCWCIGISLVRHKVAFVVPLYVPLEGLRRNIALYIDDDIVPLPRTCASSFLSWKLYFLLY